MPVYQENSDMYNTGEVLRCNTKATYYGVKGKPSSSHSKQD